MWHPVQIIAENRKLDVDGLVTFARQNKDRYGIAYDAGGFPLVNTWYVDDLVKAFKALRTDHV